MMAEEMRVPHYEMELEFLNRQLRELHRQNQALRLQNEISGLEREIGILQLSIDQPVSETFGVSASTPDTYIKRKYATPLDQRRRRRLPPTPEFSILSNIPEVSSNIGDSVLGGNEIQLDDRFVTHRRRKAEHLSSLNFTQDKACQTVIDVHKNRLVESQCQTENRNEVKTVLAENKTNSEQLVTRTSIENKLNETPSKETFETDKTKGENTALQKRSVMIKPATYDGSHSWIDYKAHFEACAEINKWTEKEKGLYLSVSLRGSAQGVFGNLTSKTPDYKDLVTALEQRFSPPNQTELYRAQLRERRQKASETLSELGQDIRRLINLAYPSAPIDVKETLAKEQFLDSLFNSDMRLRIKQARPVDLNDAIRHAVELEAYHKAECKHLNDQGYIRYSSERNFDQNDSYKNRLDSLQKTVDKIPQTFEAMNKSHSDKDDRNYRSHGNQTYTNSNYQNISQQQNL